MTYRNPVIPGCYPDPSVCRVGGDYYLVTSSFEYFPGVPIFHSRDLVRWTQIGHCLTRPSQLPLEGAHSSGGIYAPTIREHAGVFYMVTTNTTGAGNFVVRATDPRGPWSEPLWLDQGGIDPSLWFDDEGVLLSTPGAGGIELVRIDLDTGKKVGPPRTIWPGTGGRYLEGPHLYRLRGRYYLLAAEGGTEHGHMVVIARSSSPWGPFEGCPRNPILTHRSVMSPLQNLGHADLVEAEDGSFWMVCLGTRPVGYPDAHVLGRETMLAPVEWDADGWPVVGNQGRLAVEMTGPAGAVTGSRPSRDDFDAPTLGLDWTFLRNPRAEDWSLAERPGWLRLRGSAVALEEVGSPAWVGRRQTHHFATARALLSFEPSSDGDEAGLTIRMNERHHYDLFVTTRGGQRSAVARLRIGPLAKEVAQSPLAGGPVTLEIAAEPETYSLRANGAELVRAESRYLSTEVAGGFTGVFFAMYATGNGRPCAAPADFDWFEYAPGAGEYVRPF